MIAKQTQLVGTGGLNKRRRLRLTISIKTAMAFLVIIVLVLANFLVADNLLTKISRLSDTVVMTAKLRILSKKIANLSQALQPGDQVEQAQIRSQMEDFEKELNVWDSHHAEIERFIGASGQDSLVLLEYLRSDWQAFRDSYYEVMRTMSDVPAFRKSLQRLGRNAEELQASANGLVYSLVKHSEDFSKSVQSMLYVIAFLDVLLLLGVFYAIRRHVVAPVTQLSNATRRFSRGEYSVRVNYDSRDEIGDLADAFNQTAAHTQSLIARIESDGNALRKAEEKFRNLVEQSLVGVFILQDGRFPYVNPRCAEIFGCSPLELTSFWGLSDMICPEGDRELTQGLETLLEGSLPVVQSEFCGRHKNGRRIELEIHATRTEVNGRPAVIGTLLDITERKRADRELRKLTHAVEQSPASVLITDPQGRIEYVNPRFSSLTGYGLGEIAGQTPRILKSGMMPFETYRDLWNTILQGDEWRGELLNRKKSGDLFWEYEIISPIKNEAGQITHFLAVKEDITARKQAEESLRLRDRALESSTNGIMIIDSSRFDQAITYVNPAFERITGYAAADILGKSKCLLLGDDREQPGLEEINAAWREKREGRVTVRNYRKDGEMFWCDFSIAPVRDPHGQVTHFVCVINDVTDRIAYEKELEHQATHDALTGLANRNLLDDRLQQAMVHGHRLGRLAAVMLLDLDRFKVINDSLGHGAGDDLLVAVSERLSACVRDGDTVARLGGDEFVIVLTDLASEDDVIAVAQKVLEEVSLPYQIEGQDLFVTTSIGVSLFPRDGTDAESLIKHADVAMYRSKESGRNAFHFFAPEMNTRALGRLEMETGLRRALDRREFVVLYQPKVDLASGAIVGAEALLRWHDPSRGVISPVDFIPLAEETGLILQVGEWVLRTACMQTAKWQAEGLPPITMAVNVSTRQLWHEGLISQVWHALKDCGLEAGYLELEITESMVMRDPEKIVDVLRELQAIGVSLSLDDFGTGYSSLAYLKRLPLNALKIDQSFVRDVERNSDDAAIAATVIAMGRSLKLKVIAEGVETRPVADFLRALRCDQAQGYLYARPLPAEEFAQLLRQRYTYETTPSLF